MLSYTSSCPYACTVFTGTTFYLQNAELCGIVTVNLNAVEELLLSWELLDILQSGEIKDGFSVVCRLYDASAWFRTDKQQYSILMVSGRSVKIVMCVCVCVCIYIYIYICLMHFLHRKM